MAEENSLEIILSLQDRVTKEFEAVKNKILGGQKEVDEQNKKSKKTSEEKDKSVLAGLKSQQQEMVSMVRLVTRVGFIWGATFGIMIKFVLDLEKEIRSLDQLSIKLGISASDLSIKFYGFNIATESARTGALVMQSSIYGLFDAMLLLKKGIGEVIGESAILAKQKEFLTVDFLGMTLALPGKTTMSREDAIGAILEENKAKRLASKEGQALWVSEDEEYRKLSMSRMDFEKSQDLERVNLLEYYGINTNRIRLELSEKYLQEDAILASQNMAERYALEGNFSQQLQAEYAIRLIAFKKLTTEEGNVARFAAVEQQKISERLKQLHLQQFAQTASGLAGLSAALTAYAGENKKAAGAAKAVALISAIVTGASVVLNALETKPFVPVGLAMGVMATAMTGLQIATIASQKFAAGGRPPMGVPSLVGERGPELFMPDSFGTIIPNHRLGGSSQTYINIEVNNPQVRSDEDIDKLTEEISLRLAREVERI